MPSDSARAAAAALSGNGRAVCRSRQTMSQAASRRAIAMAAPAAHKTAGQGSPPGVGAPPATSRRERPGRSGPCAAAFPKAPALASAKTQKTAGLPLATGTRSAGRSHVSSGSASRAAAAAVQTRCRAAAERRPSASAASEAAIRIRVDFSAYANNIYLPSRLAFSIISAMRSSSSRVRRVAETSSSAATACSGEPLKNVSSRCLTAERLAFSRATTGA